MAELKAQASRDIMTKGCGLRIDALKPRAGDRVDLRLSDGCPVEAEITEASLDRLKLAVAGDALCLRPWTQEDDPLPFDEGQQTAWTVE